VIATAQELDCVLLSLNGDSPTSSHILLPSYGGIIAIQLHNHPEIIPPLMAHLSSFWTPQSDRDYFRGKLFVSKFIESVFAPDGGLRSEMGSRWLKALRVKERRLGNGKAAVPDNG